MDLSLLPDGGLGWLDASGPKSQIVLSTRIRLARNLAGHTFSQRSTDDERLAVLDRVLEAAAASERLKRNVSFRLDALERGDRQLLHERHLVSKELAGLDQGRAGPRAGILGQARPLGMGHAASRIDAPARGWPRPAREGPDVPLALLE